MNQISQARSVSKKEFNDSTSDDFDEKMNFPQVFTFFKFQLVKFFTFFTSARSFFPFFRQRKHSDQRKHCEKQSKKAMDKDFAETVHFKLVNSLNCSCCNTDVD